MLCKMILQALGINRIEANRISALTLPNASVRHAKHLDGVARYGFPESALRHFERLDFFPRGFYRLGMQFERLPVTKARGQTSRPSGIAKRQSASAHISTGRVIWSSGSSTRSSSVGASQLDMTGLQPTISPSLSWHQSGAARMSPRPIALGSAGEEDLSEISETSQRSPAGASPARSKP